MPRQTPAQTMRDAERAGAPAEATRDRRDPVDAYLDEVDSLD
jgi:hypothetical protein